MSTKETALLLHAQGFVPVLIEPDKKKPADDAWPECRPTAEEINCRFDNNSAMNVGVLLGEAGMDIECDGEDAKADLAELFEGCDFPTTPSWEARRGPHYWFAKDDRLFALGKAVIKYKSLEIRLGAGKAAQSLLPDSTTDGFTRPWINKLSATCRPAQFPAKATDRVLADHAEKQAAKPRSEPKTEARFDSVGDDFNSRGQWGEILEPKGWLYLGGHEGVGQWKRPGKTEEGCSATTGFCKTTKEADKFYVFSTAASPFEGGQSYSKFAVFAYLYHDGDFSAAAADLAAKGYGKRKKPTTATTLIDIAASAELFHHNGEAHITADVGDHRETFSVDSRACKRLLEHGYWKKTGAAPSSKAVTEALGVIAARARFEGPEIPVYTRIAPHDGNIYLDLANGKGEVVAIRPDGYTIERNPPIKFRQPAGMLALPYPQPGKIDELRQFINVDDESWKMFVSCQVAALRPTGPYPIALYISEHGSGKSTTMRVARMNLDPNKANIRGAPDSVQTLMLAATNGLFVAIDNSSGVQPWLADSLCRISTGGGLGTRMLYTNAEESLFDVQRPTMVTGIGDLTTREDFLDRAVIIRCPEMSDEQRRDEATFYAAYEEARPRILGAILHGASTALRNLPNIKLDKLPRMADFAKWASAAETAWGWEPGTFIKAYTQNRADANEAALDNPVADSVRDLLAKHPKWNGRAEPLLTLLNSKFSTPDMRLQECWPRSGNSLSAKLNRMKPNLRKAGIAYSKHRRELSLSICA